MMPHPTTMAFAWEEEVQRCSQILVCVFMLAVVTLLGVTGLSGRAQDTTPVATGPRAQLVTTFGEARFSGDPEQPIAIYGEDALIYVEQPAGRQLLDDAALRKD